MRFIIFIVGAMLGAVVGILTVIVLQGGTGPEQPSPKPHEPCDEPSQG